MRGLSAFKLPFCKHCGPNCAGHKSHRRRKNLDSGTTFTLSEQINSNTQTPIQSRFTRQQRRHNTDLWLEGGQNPALKAGMLRVCGSRGSPKPTGRARLDQRGSAFTASARRTLPRSARIEGTVQNTPTLTTSPSYTNDSQTDDEYVLDTPTVTNIATDTPTNT